MANKNEYRVVLTYPSGMTFPVWPPCHTKKEAQAVMRDRMKNSGEKYVAHLEQRTVGPWVSSEPKKPEPVARRYQPFTPTEPQRIPKRGWQPAPKSLQPERP